MSGVTYHVSRVTCHIFLFCLFNNKNIGASIRIGREIQCLPYAGFFLEQSGGASRWRVYYQRVLPRLVFICTPGLINYWWCLKRLNSHTPALSVALENKTREVKRKYTGGLRNCISPMTRFLKTCSDITYITDITVPGARTNCNAKYILRAIKIKINYYKCWGYSNELYIWPEISYTLPILIF